MINFYDNCFKLIIKNIKTYPLKRHQSCFINISEEYSLLVDNLRDFSIFYKYYTTIIK